MNNILKRIDEIIPYNLFVLINFPIIIGCFIDLALIDFRYFLINIIWIPIFSIPSVLLKTSMPNKIGAVIIFCIGFIEITHWILIKGPISVASLLTVGATNFQESIEFLSVKSSYLFLLLLPYVVLFVFSIRKKQEYKDYKGKRTFIILTAIVSISFISENAINGRLLRKGVPHFFKVFFSFSDQYDLFKETETDNEVRKVDAYSNDNLKKTFVLILGESLNRNHMSLYNYHRNTTPKLDSRDDIYVFTDVISAYSNTINSILTSLSQANLEYNKKQDQSIDVFDVFSSAGFRTYWLSNQPPYGIWENRVSSLAKKADCYKFVNLSSNSSMEATLIASYDGKLLSPFINILKSGETNKLIIVHLMGNHTSYKKRYPNSFSLFEGSSKIEKTIAEYDNSVLYNDYIVDSLFNIIEFYSKANNRIASAIYLSDHGENVYDEGNQVGHTFSGRLPKANVEIPFVVWLSDDFKDNFPFKTIEVKKHTEKPYIIDDLFHSVLDINNITTSYLDKARSLFNEKFNDKRKRVLEDNYDYDE